MNTSDLLYPHQLSTDQLLNYLKERHLPIHNIDELSRDELIKIYNSFALPMHKRQSNTKSPTKPTEIFIAKTNTNIDNSRHRFLRQHDRIIPPNVDDVVNECKKIKLINDYTDCHLAIKRTCPKEDKMEVDCAIKRKKITWP